MVCRLVVAGSEEQILERLAEGLPTDLLLGGKACCAKRRNGECCGHIHSEQTDIVPAEFKNEEGYWTGAWYVPLFLRRDGYECTETQRRLVADLAGFDPAARVQVAMTDFLAADVPAELLLLARRVQRGKEEAFRYLQELQTNVVQYSKFLSTPVRMLALQKGGCGDCRCGYGAAVSGGRIPVEDGVSAGRHRVQSLRFRCAAGRRSCGGGSLYRLNCMARDFRPCTRKKYYVYYTGYPPEQVADALSNKLVLWPLRKEYRYDGRRDLVAQWVKRKSAAAKQQRRGDDRKG